MPEIKEIAAALDAAVADGRTPGVVAAVANRHGLAHLSAHGLRAAGGDEPMTEDSVFRVFSMTKAIGTAAAMKLVEEGHLSLDTPVADILPEFGEIQVLDGFDGDTPIMRPPRTVCTVRHLANHTSGLTYDVWNADQAKYMAVMGTPPTLSGARVSLKGYPFQFDPGTRWAYGMSTDWLGLVVEEIAGERIDGFLKREFLRPLGMHSTDVEFTPDMAGRKVSVHASTPAGFKVISQDLPSNPEFYGMGHALNSTAGDYNRFQRMILGGGELDGVRVLSEETVAAMSANSTGDLAIAPQASAKPEIGADIDLFPGIAKCYTLGFLRTDQDIPGMRRAGSLTWAGVMNTHYWIDPASGIAATLMMQHLPFVDDNALAVYAGFERAVCEAMG